MTRQDDEVACALQFHLAVLSNNYRAFLLGRAPFGTRWTLLGGNCRSDDLQS